MKKILTILAISIFSGCFLSACNTVKGAGQDIQNTGEAIEKTATDSKHRSRANHNARHHARANAHSNVHAQHSA